MMRVDRRIAAMFGKTGSGDDAMNRAIESANVESRTDIPLSQLRNSQLRHRHLRWFSVVVVAIAIIQAGCEKTEDSILNLIERKWTEDVLLDDGKIIQVNRTVTFHESRSWSGDAYNAVESDASLAFTGQLSQLPPWKDRMMALVLYNDKATGEWVIVTTATSCLLWRWRSKPRPMYWEFRLDKDGWREVPLSPGSIGRPANLLHRYQSKLPSDHITVEDRRRLESSPRMGKEFREILPVTPGCTGMD